MRKVGVLGVITNAKHSLRENIKYSLSDLSLDELAVVNVLVSSFINYGSFPDSMNGSKERPFIVNEEGVDNASYWYWYYAQKLSECKDVTDDISDYSENMLWWKRQMDEIGIQHRRYRGMSLFGELRRDSHNAYCEFPDACLED